MSSDPRLSSSEFLYAYNGTKTIVISSVFIALEVIFVALRTYSRSLTELWGVDDILIWVSLPICLAVDAVCIGLVKYAGVGRHQLALLALGESFRVLQWGKFVLALGWVYIIAVTLPKLCILSLYLRIFYTKPYRVACYVLGAIMIGSCVGGITAAMLICRPLARFWNPSIPGKCGDIRNFLLWVGFPNLATDVVLLILPLPMLWKLQVSKQQKMSLMITFLMGSVGLISSILRFRVFLTEDVITDTTWATADLAIWTVVEPGMYFIAACLIKLRPLVKNVVRRASMSFPGRKSTGSDGRICIAKDSNQSNAT